MKRISAILVALFAAIVFFATPVWAQSLFTIQAGTIELSSDYPSEINNRDTSTFTQVYFPTPFPEGSRVVVIPMVETFNGSDTPGLRIADVTTTGFKIRMNELVAFKGGKQVLSDGAHGSETIGWIAFSN